MSPITHAFHSEKSDPSDDTLIKPSNWNDDHVGGTPFSGCRFQMDDAGEMVQLLGGAPSPTLSYYMNNNMLSYDTDSYGTFDGGGLTTDGYLVAPVAGYYRIATGVRVDFSGSDSTFAEFTIVSPDRDNSWDIVDHFTVHPGAHESTGALSVTHWLDALDRVSLVHIVDGTTRPFAFGSLEMTYVGSGANPNP